MSYTIKLTNGNVLAVIPDGTLNTQTTMTLVGENYVGYGQFLDDNFVYLLENSSNNTPPPHPLVGQLWWDSSNTILKVYDGHEFRIINNTFVGTQAPPYPTVGELWYNSTSETLNVYSGTLWITVGPSVNNGTGTRTTTIQDNIGANHSVVEILVGASVVGIVSKDPSFTPANAIPGFTVVGPGYNVANSINGVPQYFQGTSTNALTLQGYEPGTFMPAFSDANTTGTLTVFNNGGITIGSSRNFKLFNQVNDDIIENTTVDGNIIINLNKNTNQSNVAVFYGSNLGVSFSNAVSARYYFGDGGGLTNLPPPTFSVNNIAILKSLPKSQLSVYVEGYYNSGDGGGGNYYYDPTDTTSLDNGGTIIVATDGARWKLSHQDQISVKQFGARGDGVTNDYQSLQQAFTNIGGTVYIPSGIYLFNTGLVMSEQSLALVGSGQETILKYGGSGTALSFNISDTSNTGPKLSVTSLKILNSSTPSSCCVAVNNTRMTPGIDGSIDTVWFTDVMIDSESYWTKGLFLNNIGGVYLVNTSILNNNNLNAEQTPGIYGVHIISSIPGENVIRGLHLSNCYIQRFYNCIYQDLAGGASIESLYVENTELLGYVGYNCVGGQAIGFVNCHFDTVSSSMYIQSGAVIRVTGCDLRGTRTTATTDPTIFVGSEFGHGTWVGNFIQANNRAASVVTINGGSDLVFEGNQIMGSRGSYGFKILGTSNNCTTTNNVFTPSIVVNNQYFVESSTTNIIAYPTQPTQYSVSYTTPTLTGGSPTETFNVPLPTNRFLSKPSVVNITSQNSDSMIYTYQYNNVGTTATNLTVTVRDVTGVNIVPGTSLKISLVAIQ